jgi:hypothetical protein
LNLGWLDKVLHKFAQIDPELVGGGKKQALPELPSVFHFGTGAVSQSSVSYTPTMDFIRIPECR